MNEETSTDVATTWQGEVKWKQEEDKRKALGAMAPGCGGGGGCR